MTSRVSAMVFVSALALAACSGDGAGPATGPIPLPSTAPSVEPTAPEPSPTTESSSTSIAPIPTSTTPPVTAPTTAPSSPASAGDVVLLVPAPEGLALWDDDEVTWLLRDRAVARAVPDLSGGVLFQYVDPAQPNWVWVGNRWVTQWLNGAPEPILRQRVPGGPIETAVPNAGSRIWLLDSGTVGGVPTIAFGRLVGGDDRIAVGFDYCDEVDMCGEFSWRVELVLRAVDGGDERVVHDALWRPGITESTRYDVSLGHDLVALTVHPYAGGGEYASGSVELLDPDGEPIDRGDGRDLSCEWCALEAVVAPDRDVLAYTQRHVEEWTETPIGPQRLVLVDSQAWTEHWRVELPQIGRAIDTDGEQVVVELRSEATFEQPPTLANGDSGVWVERLQAQLNRFVDAGLVVDGEFGPATERAVRAWQRLTGREVSGVMESSSWSLLYPDRSVGSRLVVASADGITPIDLTVGWNRSDPGGGVSIWPGSVPDVAVGLDRTDLLRRDGLGPVDFGTPADEAIAALTELLGPADADRSVDADSMECVEGSDWHNCLPVASNARLLSWQRLGLHALLTDFGGWDDGPITVPVHFGWWRAARPAVGPPLTDADGLGPGSSFGEVRAAHPDVEFGYGEGVVAGFWIDETYRGTVDWDPASPTDDWSEAVRAVQQALNAAGAGLAVDGEWGPRSQQAWERFLVDRDLGPVLPTMWLTAEIGDALGLPPDGAAVGSMIASGP